MTTSHNAIGLALGSGGIRGLAHVGVIKKLVEHNIPIDFIAGSSIGSWVGAHYALFQDLELLEEITVGRHTEKFRAFIEPTINGGLVKGIKMEKLIDSWLLKKNFSDTKIPFRAVATDLITGNSIVLREGKLAPALRASMSIPTLFAPFLYQEQLLVDGGLSQPVPDEVVKQMGADIVISVNLDNYIKNDEFGSEKQNSLRHVATRSINIIRYHLSKYSTTHSDIIIEPYTPAVGASSFRNYFRKKIVGVELVKSGENETEKVIEKIKELMKD